MKKGLLTSAFANIAAATGVAKEAILHGQGNKMKIREAMKREDIDYPAPPGVALTEGEIALVKSVFGEKIDEDDLRRYKKLFTPQNFNKTSAAVLGSSKRIKFYGQKQHEADYSQPKDPSNLYVFMHEMTHVWQEQRKMPVSFQNKRRPNADEDMMYYYKLSPHSRFKDFPTEQQASIIGEYALLFLYTDASFDANFMINDNTPENEALLQRVVEDAFPEARKTRLLLEPIKKAKSDAWHQKLKFAESMAHDITGALKKMHDKPGLEFKYDVSLNLQDDKAHIKTNIPVKVNGYYVALHMTVDTEGKISASRERLSIMDPKKLPVDPAMALPLEDKMSSVLQCIHKGYASSKRPADKTRSNRLQ